MSSEKGLFHAAVGATLNSWTALQMAVTQGAGGAQSAAIAQWMIDATVQWFAENKDLEVDEVEDFFADIINQEFNLIVDDGSLTDVSKNICEFYSLSKSPNAAAELQKRIAALPKCDLSRCKVDVTEEVSEEPANDNTDDGDCMDVDDGEKATEAVTSPQTAPDPDGWTVVTRKKK